MPELSDTLRDLQFEITQGSKRGTERAAKWLARRIVERTRSGRDVNGRFFKGYSANTRKRGRVNLTGKTKRMLNSVKAKPVKSTGRGRAVATVEVGDRQKAAWHQFGTEVKGEQRLPVRHWFGASRRDEREMARMIQRSSRAVKPRPPIIKQIVIGG